MGTTLKVARRLGRKGIGYEINSDYKKIIDNVLKQKLLVEF
jgi:DNA modification methylase